MADPLSLVTPSLAQLPAYVSALERGWWVDHLRGVEAACEELARIAADPRTWVAAQTDREGRGTVTLPDGSTAPRIPGYRLWMWDGEFVGVISLRWVPGTAALPPHVLGHVGYSVVPWKRQRGYAKAALGMMLLRARVEGLTSLEITTDPDNIASRRAIEANGGVLVESFQRPAAYGGGLGLRYQIDLPAAVEPAR